jgi:hypothetical protein
MAKERKGEGRTGLSVPGDRPGYKVSCGVWGITAHAHPRSPKQMVPLHPQPFPSAWHQLCSRTIF